MNHSPFSKPMQLGHLLQNLVRRRGLAEQSSGRELDELWKAVAGTRVAEKSFVKRLRSGILEVGVTNGVILEELTCYLQHELLQVMQEKHPDPPINSLKFVKAR